MVAYGLGAFSIDLESAFQHHTTTFVGPREEGESVHLAVIKKKVLFRPNLVITGSDAPLTDLTAYVEEQIAALRAVRGFRQLGREGVTLADGAAGILQHHAFDNENGIHVEQYQVYVRQADRALIATATHLAGAPFSRWEARFKVALLGLRAGQPPER